MIHGRRRVGRPILRTFLCNCKVHVAAALRDVAWLAAERRAYNRITTLISSRVLSHLLESDHRRSRVEGASHADDIGHGQSQLRDRR
jgi:hypothetical protein